MSAVKVSAMAAFATQLKAWRKRGGWSQEVLAGKLVCSNSLVSGIETMDKTPTLDFAVRLDEIFGTPGTFTSMHELISREAWPSYFAPVIDFEAQSVRLHEWELRAIPGLLQTERYARSVISAGKPRYGQEDLDRAVNGRMDRQRVLARDKPPMYWTVLYEGLLRHAVGSYDAMAEQLDKLVDLAQTPDVVLQILPFTAHDHPGTDGSITVFDFEDAGAAAYTECNGGGMITETPEAVADLMTTMNLIRAAALSRRESMTLLRQIRSEMGT